MKTRTKKLTAISLGLIIGTSTFATVLQAETITKTLKATYNNIKVTFNGDAKQPANEPFLINGAVYVSLRDAGQMTGNTVNWDSANKTVQITNSNTGSGSASSTEIANKNLEIANLKAQIKQFEEKLAKYEKEDAPSTDSNLSASAISKTLDQIEDDYENKHNVNWEFDLTENKGALKLELIVPKNSSSKFNDITPSRLETLLTSICKDIAYNHKNVEIKGTIYDNKVDEEVIDFTYSTKGKLSIGSTSINQYALERFAETLSSDRNYRALPTINIEELQNESFTVDRIELEYDKRKDMITFFVGVDTTKKDAWNKLITDGGNDDSSTLYKDAQLDNLAYFLDDIADDIADEFDINAVEGMIYNTNGLSTRAPLNDGKLMVRYELDRNDYYKMRLVAQ